MIQNRRQLVTLTTSLKQVLILFLETKSHLIWLVFVYLGKERVHVHRCMCWRKQTLHCVCLLLNKECHPKVNGLRALPLDVLNSTLGTGVAGQRCDGLVLRPCGAKLSCTPQWRGRFIYAHIYVCSK